MTIAVETRELSKIYGKLQALQSANLQVPAGSCFGLLGPNGAGKSTLVKVLLSIVRPSSGGAELNGVDIRNHQARRKVGYLPEGFRPPRYLTGESACRYFGRLAGLSGEELRRECDEKLALVGLAERKRDKVHKYSKGMNQRLGLAQSLLGSPSLVFLDEPTDGVDAMGRKDMRQVIRESCERGTTFVVNSHILSEVEEVCDQIAILHQGRLLESGSVSEIKARVSSSGQTLRVRIRTGGVPDPLWQSLHQRGAERMPDQFFQIPLENEEGIPPLLDELRSHQVAVYAVTPMHSNLEDAFVALIRGQDNPASPNAGGQS